MGYVCCRCGGSFEGMPKLKTPGKANSMCPDCHADMVAKSRDRFNTGICVYCGGKLGEGDSPTVHKECEDHRDWVLKCFKYSSKLGDYIDHRRKEWEDERERIRVAKRNDISSLFHKIAELESEVRRLGRK